VICCSRSRRAVRHTSPARATILRVAAMGTG
jgi:hypothetical protein